MALVSSPRPSTMVSMMLPGCCATVISVLAVPAVAAAAAGIAMVASPRLSAKVLRLGCFSTVASMADSVCGALIAWALSVAAVLAVMAA